MQQRLFRFIFESEKVAVFGNIKEHSLPLIVSKLGELKMNTLCDPIRV